MSDKMGDRPASRIPSRFGSGVVSPRNQATQAANSTIEKARNAISDADKRTFAIHSEQHGSPRLMSEDEVSSLVHNALRRARQATSASGAGPRRRTRRNFPVVSRQKPAIVTTQKAIPSPTQIASTYANAIGGLKRTTPTSSPSVNSPSGGSFIASQRRLSKFLHTSPRAAAALSPRSNTSSAFSPRSNASSALSPRSIASSALSPRSNASSASSTGHYARIQNSSSPKVADVVARFNSVTQSSSASPTSKSSYHSSSPLNNLRLPSLSKKDNGARNEFELISTKPSKEFGPKVASIVAELTSKGSTTPTSTSSLRGEFGDTPERKEQQILTSKSCGDYPISNQSSIQTMESEINDEIVLTDSEALLDEALGLTEAGGCDEDQIVYAQASGTTADSDQDGSDVYDKDLGAPTLSSVNSSDAIIRRVEEEIANARKAAQDANRRLADVSTSWEVHGTFSGVPISKSAEASLLTHTSSGLAGTPKRAPALGGSFTLCSPGVPSNLTNDTDLLDGDEEAIQALLSVSDGAIPLMDGDEGSYHSAMDVIGEEFGFEATQSKSSDATEKSRNLHIEIVYHSEEATSNEEDEVEQVSSSGSFNAHNCSTNHNASAEIAEVEESIGDTERRDEDVDKAPIDIAKVEPTQNMETEGEDLHSASAEIDDKETNENMEGVHIDLNNATEKMDGEKGTEEGTPFDESTSKNLSNDNQSNEPGATNDSFKQNDVAKGVKPDIVATIDLMENANAATSMKIDDKKYDNKAMAAKSEEGDGITTEACIPSGTDRRDSEANAAEEDAFEKQEVLGSGVGLALEEPDDFGMDPRLEIEERLSENKNCQSSSPRQSDSQNDNNTLCDNDGELKSRSTNFENIHSNSLTDNPPLCENDGDLKSRLTNLENIHSNSLTDNPPLCENDGELKSRSTDLVNIHSDGLTDNPTVSAEAVAIAGVSSVDSQGASSQSDYLSQEQDAKFEPTDGLVVNGLLLENADLLQQDKTLKPDVTPVTSNLDEVVHSNAETDVKLGKRNPVHDAARDGEEKKEDPEGDSRIAEPGHIPIVGVNTREKVIEEFEEESRIIDVGHIPNLSASQSTRSMEKVEEDLHLIEPGQIPTASRNGNLIETVEGKHRSSDDEEEFFDATPHSASDGTNNNNFHALDSKEPSDAAQTAIEPVSSKSNEDKSKVNVDEKADIEEMISKLAAHGMSSGSGVNSRSPTPKMTPRSPSPHMYVPNTPGPRLIPRSPSPAEYAKKAAHVQKRREVRNRANGARAAIVGELDAPKQKDTIGSPQSKTDSDPDEQSEASRSRKVRFRQRYPVPPLIAKPRPPLTIIKDNELGEPNCVLHLAKPKRDLKELLDAIFGPSLPRRSNACGALKVLSTKPKNKLTLVRTSGFLDALVFAADQAIDPMEEEIYVDARTRAVNTLLNVTEPKDNRVIVLCHPRVPQCLVKVIVEDSSEARASACGTIALLAKTAACRESLVKVKKLIEVLATIVKGVDDTPSIDERKGLSSDDADDEESHQEFGKSCSSESSSDSMSSASSARSHSFEDIPQVDSIRQKKIEQSDEMAKRSRFNACAALIHLSKHCAVSQTLCSNSILMTSLVIVSQEYENPIHTKALEILCNLTRFPANAETMSAYPGLVDTLVVNGRSKVDSDRVWALRALQNLSSDVAGKTVLANTIVLELLSVSVMRKQYDEQLAATATLYNLSTEPGAVVPLTNTKNVVATLVHVAHNPDSTSNVRLLACDALATLGLWLQTLAGAGTVPGDVESVPLPSYATTGWDRWD